MYDGYRMCRLTDCCQTFTQHAKEVVSNSLGLVDFAIGLVNSVLNFSAQLASEVFLGIQITEQLLSKSLFGLVKMTFELVHANYSLSEWQASCKTDFLCTLPHSSNIIWFLYFNLHLLKIDFIFLQNGSSGVNFFWISYPTTVKILPEIDQFYSDPLPSPIHSSGTSRFLCWTLGPF